MQFARHVPLKGDRLLEALVIVAFFMLIAMLMTVRIPPANREMVATGLGGVGALALLVGKSLWERNGAAAVAASNTADAAANTAEAIAKIPPVGSAVDQPALTFAPSNEGPEVNTEAKAGALDLSSNITGTGVAAGFIGASAIATNAMPTIHAPISPGTGMPPATEIME